MNFPETSTIQVDVVNPATWMTVMPVCSHILRQLHGATSMEPAQRLFFNFQKIHVFTISHNFRMCFHSFYPYFKWFIVPV